MTGMARMKEFLGRAIPEIHGFGSAALGLGVFRLGGGEQEHERE
jgi:hypothetical protein